MPSSCVLRSVTFVPDGRILVDFDGNQLEFYNMEHLSESVAEADSQLPQTQLMCLGYAKARSSDLSNLGSVKDKTFTFNLSQPQPIRVQ